jgi:hypothetical protein
MGWYYTLNFTCKVLPEYYDFIQNYYIFNRNQCYKCIDTQPEPTCKCNNVMNYHTLSKSYRDLIDIWMKLKIGNCFREYDFDRNSGIFKCISAKKVIRHGGNLWDDYMLFMKDIIVPITSHISYCNLSSDDFGDISVNYTDNELRDKYFKLNNHIKSIEHKWENGDIIETRVIYKRSLKNELLLDLNRAYGIKD